MSDDETISRLDSQMSDLKRQRGVVKGRLTLFANYINKLDRSCLDSVIKTQVQMRIHSAAIFFAEFNDLQSKLERIVDEKELLSHLEYRDSFECQYYSTVAIAKNMIGDCEQMGLNNSQCTTGKSVSIKLPQIKLPVFDGSFDKWLEFRNSYVTMIHDRDDLDPIQKFQYLKSSLSGSAINVISSLEFTAPNYSNAWDLLEARYQNNRLLIHNHVKALFAAPSLGKECPTQIRTLVDCVLRNLRALNSLKEPESSLEDMLIIYIIVSKLDSATEREWENYRSSLISDSHKTSKPLKLEDLLTFLNNRSDMLDMISSGNSKNNQSHSQSKNEGKQSADHKKQNNSQTTLSYASVNNNNKVSSGSKSKTNKHNLTCPLCSDKHALYSCVKFLNMFVQERLNFVQSKNVCQNCLRTNTHTIENCKFGPCKLCQQKHNALIHVDNNSVIPNTSSLRSVINNTLPQSSVLHCVSKTADNIDNSKCNAFVDNAKSLQTVLLSTALVEIADIDNRYHTVRALLDSGSQNCFIAQSLCKRLNLPIIQSTIRVCGVGQTVSQSSHKCDVNIRSKVYDFNTTLHCLVLPSIISKLPSTHVKSDAINIPSNILLADPTFYVPSDIDLLIGADVFWDLLKENKIKLHTGPYLQDSWVGWIISGPVYNNNRFFAAGMSDVQCNLSLVDSQLRQFWEIEEVNIPPVITEEDRSCEELFLQTTERDQHGRFTVRMPLKQSPDCLGDSYNSALQRFLSLEKKLNRLPQYKKMYCDFMHEYEQLGHMTLFADFNSLNKPYYIVPHHGVYRESSVTTKLRVVFDASAITSNHNSLNDIQYVGPRLQNDIFSILLRFRQYKYVACADIEKFFRQCLIHTEQRNLQLILWRTDNNMPIQVYRLNTVTYGTASAPYLSNRCLKQLAKECKDDVIASVINDDFYVDDLLTGHDQRDMLLDICNKTSVILQSGCFPLRKWSFNFDVTSESTKDLCIGEYCQSKTLGVGWSNKNDLFNFSTCVNKCNSDTKLTKRLIMSVIAQIYDPLGLLAPAITTAKVLLQKLWLAKISWDDEVPSQIACVWYNFINSLQYLSEILVPRYVMCTNAVNKELHIFTDASQSAYGACAYIRSHPNSDESQVTCRLLCAKSKVAPIKALSIPRLELCGALVGAKLYNKIITSLRLKFDKIYFWTDSTIVQAWLRTSPHLLKTFVQNRVVQINELTSNTTWLHVKSKENPADILSRGVLFDSLMDNTSLWWCGPIFLCEPTSSWLTTNSNQTEFIDNNKLPELKCPKTTNLLNVESCNINVIDFDRFSCFNRLQRTMAYVLRYIFNLRASRVGQGRKTGSLTVSEINSALVVLTRLVQSQSFSKEYHNLKEKLPLTNKSSNKTIGLSLFLDNDNIIRVGGRLSNSKFNYDKKHPVLLCHKHRFTWLLCSYEHKRLLHAGPQLLVATMRDRWWVLGARNLARLVVHKCVTCIRMKGNTLTPLMGDLPAERLEAGFPFMRCGVDYAGPVSILNRKGRGSQLIKGYICLFVCFATRAVHLELVSSLSTQDYIMAFKRFISRRGKPCQVFSDNGRNFVGAEKELTAIFEKSNEIIDFASSNNIIFSFIPPYAPHFGGLWEAGVKSCKYHLRRVVGNAKLTYEEFGTVLTQVEAVLNSRPMSPMSTDPTDYLPLTPAHFLIGRPLTAPASEDFTTSKPACRYHRVEQLRQHFWKRWSKEYVSELQRRTKWAHKTDDIAQDSLVVIKEDNLPPLKWRMGRIIKLFPGNDGVSRVAEIQTSQGTIKRASSKICPLPV